MRNELRLATHFKIKAKFVLNAILVLETFPVKVQLIKNQMLKLQNTTILFFHNFPLNFMQQHSLLTQWYMNSLLYFLHLPVNSKLNNYYHHFNLKSK